MVLTLLPGRCILSICIEKFSLAQSELQLNNGREEAKFPFLLLHLLGPIGTCGNLPLELWRILSYPFQTWLSPIVIPCFPTREWELVTDSSTSEIVCSVQSRPQPAVVQRGLLARYDDADGLNYLFSFFFIGDTKVKSDFAGFMAWSITLLRIMIALPDLVGNQQWDLIWWSKHFYNTALSWCTTVYWLRYRQCTNEIITTEGLDCFGLLFNTLLCYKQLRGLFFKPAQTFLFWQMTR